MISSRPANDFQVDVKVEHAALLAVLTPSTGGKQGYFEGKCKSGEARRAMQNMDLDFIRYSLRDDSIRSFISRLNCLDGVAIQIAGEIEEQRDEMVPFSPC